MTNLSDGGLGVVNSDDLECCAGGVIAERDFDAYADRVFGEANPLRQVRLEDQTEGPLRPHAVNMFTQIGT